MLRKCFLLYQSVKRRADGNKKRQGTLLQRYNVHTSWVNLTGWLFRRETLPGNQEDREKLAWRALARGCGCPLSYVGSLSYKDNGRALGSLASAYTQDQHQGIPNQFLREQFALFATVLGWETLTFLLETRIFFLLLLFVLVDGLGDAGRVE